MKQHLTEFWTKLKNTRLESWIEELPPLIDEALSPENNGNLERWLPALEAIFALPSADEIHLNSSAIQALTHNFTQQDELKTQLKKLMPWRKGPYELNEVYIDTEWRSDFKWDRVQPHLADLTDRKVLDVGCGSGYHLWRMLGSGAKLAVGIDPSALFMAQFTAVKHLLGKDLPAFFLPLPLEKLPESNYGGEFDTVFSMGVLYHRRSPIDHIYELKKQMKNGGELVLETLVIPEEFGQVLLPEDRYAQMRNVWFLPSVDELTKWLARCGFENIRCVDLDQTSLEEQRTTEWMDWLSLKDFLDPNDINKTIEGYPAPLRAVMLANKPK